MFSSQATHAFVSGSLVTLDSAAGMHTQWAANQNNTWAWAGSFQ